MLKTVFTKAFKKDLKLAGRRGMKLRKLDKVIEMLANGKRLPAKYRDHALMNYGDYDGVRECHIEPDWLLVYHVDEDCLQLLLLRTGTHSDLF